MKNKPKFNVKSAPANTPATQTSNAAQKLQQSLGAPGQPQKPPSVMIAVPAMEMVNAEFAQHLAMAAANMVANGIKINCAFNIGSVITIARRNLTDIFLKSDFDFIWWVDSDMKFPIDAPLRLLSRGKPLVGCNYRRRRFPNPNFTGMKGTSGNFSEFKTEDTSPDMELIDVLPHGMVMAHRSVYEKIPQPHYFEIWCDQALSKEIAHIGIFHFNYNLSVPQ